jgi:DNA-binding MarR family transcriptional regulator
MTSTSTTRPASSAREVDHLASELIPRASLLVRLLVKQVGVVEASRTEIEVLATLEGGPRRITELAELEGLAQPTMTLLARRLEQRGWVRRGGLRADGRVVIVSITPAGRAALARLRARFRDAVRADLEGIGERELRALSDASAALGRLVQRLQDKGEP